MLMAVISAAVLTVSGVPVTIQANADFGKVYRVSAQAAAGTEAALRRILVQAAAQRTLQDGALAFSAPSSVYTALTQEVRIQQAQQDVRRTRDGASFYYSFREVPESYRDKAI